MSDANTPNSTSLPESKDSSSSDWYSGWEDFSGEAERVSDTPASSLSDPQAEDWQTIDFPNAMSVDAIARHPSTKQSSDWAQTASPPPVNPPVEVQTPLPEPPRVAELINLIQELNHCNNTLLDRVSQLEGALERSQAALQAEVARAQDSASVSGQNSQERIVLQEQAAHLFNQLEFAHQASQRQQILIETLTTQLESSQERVAQLERECALTQQRYDEQSHLFVQSENSCRDLRSRLQRQQRYTLQFKVALEKCLEVPPPSYGIPTEAANSTPLVQPSEPQSNLIPQPLLPRVQRIQPWSSHPQTLAEKLHLDSLLDQADFQPLPEVKAQDEELNDGSQFDAIANLSDPPSITPMLKPPLQSLEILNASSGSVTVPVPEARSLSYDLKQKPVSVDAETLSSSELEPLDLPDIPTESLSDLSPEVIQSGVAELQSALGDFWKEPIADGTEDAEGILWQDLAKLIDVSTEDLIKAVSGDFPPFESIAEPAQVTNQIDSSDQTVAPPIPQIPTSQHDPATQRLLDLLTQPGLVEEQLQESETPGLPSAFAASSSWPSPVVHPLRPHKKIQSLAAVDLPTFPK